MDVTRLDIHQVYELNIIGFFNYLSYAKSKILYNNEKVKKRMAEIRRRNGK